MKRASPYFRLTSLKGLLKKSMFEALYSVTEARPFALILTKVTKNK